MMFADPRHRPRLELLDRPLRCCRQRAVTTCVPNGRNGKYTEYMDSIECANDGGTRSLAGDAATAGRAVVLRARRAR